MANPAPTIEALVPSFVSIAMIDDGLTPVRLEHIPEAERGAVLDLFSDTEVLEDFAVRGLDSNTIAANPDDAIEALTDPGHSHGMAFAKISDVSSNAVRMIERRQMMRQIANSIRNTGGCEVVELGPEDDLSDIARFDVVFIDYYLDDKESDATRAEEIASEVQGKRTADSRQQIVLMSTFEAVRAMRTEFRKNASIEAASFAFVAKGDLNEDWKVEAHLDMLARGMQHSAALGDYISAVKSRAREAADKLSADIDDLDIGDFAYIQRIALHADGHPLGDYLSWLLSSHLTALAFEGELRAKQSAVDRMEFEDGPLSPSEPSTMLASLYHNALFARNLGALAGHPRADAASPIADVPFVQLGDVFLTADKSSAVVVLSPDCDLAFSTDPTRPPNRDLGVILLFGDPNSVGSDVDKSVSSTTDAMVDGAEVYRIDWRFNSFRTVQLGALAGFLETEGFDTSKRDRLRPVYSLKLQHELGNHLMRVGPPVMPPIARHARAKIRYVEGAEVKDVELAQSEVVLSQFKKKTMVRLTPSLVSKIKWACAQVRDSLKSSLDAMPTDGDDAAQARKPLQAKLDGLSGQLEGSRIWSSLLRDAPLPGPGECKKVAGPVHIAHASGWSFPSQPAVVLLIGDQPEDEKPNEDDETDTQGDPLIDEAQPAVSEAARAAAKPVAKAPPRPARPAVKPARLKAKGKQAD